MTRALTILVLLFSVAASGQLSTSKRYINRTYGRPNVVVDSSNNYYVVKYSNLFAFGQGTGLLITKHNAQGQRIWSKLYNQSQRINSFGAQYLRGKIYVSGNLYNGSCVDQGFLTAFDLDGKIDKSMMFNIDAMKMAGFGGITSDPAGNLYFAVIGGVSGCTGPYSAYLASVDSNLNFRWAKKIEDPSGTYFVSSFVGNKILLGHSKGYYRYSTNGDFEQGFEKSDSLGAAIYFDNIFEANGRHYQVWIYSYFDYYFQLVEFDANANPVRSSKFYRGYPGDLTSDPDGNIHILAPQTTGATTFANYYQLSADLDLQDCRILTADSLNGFSSIVAECDNHIRTYGTIGSMGPAYEYDLLKDYTGSIQFNRSQADTITPNLKIIADTLISATVATSATAFNLVHYADTTLSPVSLYRYPTCQTNVDLFDSDTLVCNQDPIDISAATWPGAFSFPDSICNRPILSYSWSHGQNSPIGTISKTGKYYVTVNHANCYYLDSIDVVFDDVYEYPDSVYAHCFDSIPKYSISIDPRLSGAWNDVPGTTLNTTKPGIFTFEGTSPKGCPIVYSSFLNNRCDWMVYLPNAFTPDGDGNNDYFRPMGEAMLSWKLVVFDRFGTEVYEGDQYADGWNGKDKNGDEVNGLYITKLTYIEPDSGAEKTVYGRLMIQR